MTNKEENLKFLSQSLKMHQRPFIITSTSGDVLWLNNASKYIFSLKDNDKPNLLFIDEKDLDQLINYANVRLFSVGEYISLEGTKSDGINILLKGKVEASFTNLKNEQVLLILGKGIEEYQLYKENKIAHNDSRIVKELILLILDEITLNMVI